MTPSRARTAGARDANDINAMDPTNTVGQVNGDGRVVPVEIYGRRYPVRSSLEQEYVARLAAYVDDRMRAASDSTPSGDALRFAVLAALNIADELFRARDVNAARNGKIAERTEELERLLDRVLMS
jgi:cell division protein ZapA